MKMSNTKWAAFGGCVVAVLSGAAYADETGNPADNDADASVRVVEPLTISSQSDLRFGAFVIGPTFGTSDRIYIEDSGNRATSDPTAFIFLNSVAHGPATFLVTGEPDTQVNVFPPTPPGPYGALGAGMELENLDVPVIFGTPHTLPANGSEIIPMGGTLKVTNPGAVVPGTYTLPFTITIQYD